jgi:hypothetical protein
MKPKTVVKLAPGAGSRWTGWQKRIGDLVDQVAADVEGLGLRLKNPARPGIPAAYRAERVFEPERSTLLVDTLQTNVGTNLVNYVVRDGQVYDIPCKFPGDGVFVVKFIKVAITQRVFVTPDGAAMQLASPMVMQGWADRPGLTAPNKTLWTTKFSVFPRQPAMFGSGQSTEALYGAVNYFWNARDDRTGRFLGSDRMPCTDLLPGTAFGSAGPVIEFSSVAIPDGGLYEVSTPWLFERDGQVTFRWYPITPIFQFDSSLSGTSGAVGLTYDDRENGTRNQPVTVAVEYHGYRYRTDQDAIRAGAITRY